MNLPYLSSPRSALSGVGCLKITENKVSNADFKPMPELRSTLSATWHYINAKVVLIIKRNTCVASSIADLNQGCVSTTNVRLGSSAFQHKREPVSSAFSVTASSALCSSTRDLRLLQLTAIILGHLTPTFIHIMESQSPLRRDSRGQYTPKILCK